MGGGLAHILATGDFSEIIWALIIVAIFQIVLSLTPLGLHTVATGGNPLGAREVGVSVSRIKILFFMLTAVLGGLGGIMEAFRITSIDPQAGGGVGWHRSSCLTLWPVRSSAALRSTAGLGPSWEPSLAAPSSSFSKTA